MSARNDPRRSPGAPSARLAGACGLALLAGALSAVSCTSTPPTAECEAACAVASRCGLLPSALGGAVGQTASDNEQDCVARCTASDAERPQVTRLLARLGEAELPEAEPLCAPEGTAACEALIAELERDLDTSELVVTTDLTIRMVSMTSHAAGISLSSWCCFDYDHELDHEAEHEEVTSEDIDEIAAVYELLEPTWRCLDQTREHAVEGYGASLGEMPDPDVAAMQCEAIRALWGERAPDEPMDLEADPCYFARSSGRLQRLEISARAEACEPAGLDALAKDMGTVLDEWGFRQGVLLGEPSGAVLDVEGVRQVLQDRIRDELTRPRALLESACAQLYEELGEGGCEALDRAAALDEAACMGGPLCSAADCLAGATTCDASLCDAELPPPGRECGLLAIGTVRLGYRDAQGLEVLGEPIAGCEALDEVVTTFEDVKVGAVIPIAVVSGTLPSSFVPDDLPATYAGEFSWIEEGHVRWVTAGATELELPSPLLDQLELEYDDPLETLGWVPRRLLPGQACQTQPEQCEGYFNDNCDNGIDDDGDGLRDDASPWCDELYRVLVQRCVVTEPGQAPPGDCLP